MTTQTEALKLALEALERIANETYDSWTNGAEAGRIARSALSKIKNKCHAIQASDQMTCECGNVWDMNDPSPPKCAAIKEALSSPNGEATPLPQRQCNVKPLTNEEIMNIAKVSCIGISPHEDALNFAKVIEAAHGIKG